jgi:predicted MFS family arabinose efflux permease
MHRRVSALPGLGPWRLLSLLTFVNALNFVDRQLIASFANYIVPDLGLSNTQFALLTGFVFVAFYVLGGLVMGVAADTLNRPKLIAGALLIWSLLTAASGAARGFASLAVPRMLIGVGEAALTPAAMSLLSERIPAGRLGFAAGVYYAGVPLGAGASLLLAGVLGPWVGWRGAFIALGIAGALLAPLVLLIREDRPARPSGRAWRAVVSEVLTDARGALGGSRALRLTIVAGLGMHLLIGAGAFEQLWLVQERGFDRGRIAILSGVAAISMGLLGNLTGGALGDLWRRRTGGSRATFLFWLLLATLPLTVSYRLAEPGSLQFWVGLGVGYFQLGAFYGPCFATLQELCAPRVRASVTAFSILVLNLGGVAGGATLCGLSVDALAAWGVSQPYTWTLLGLTLLAACAAPLFLWAGREQGREDADAVTAPGKAAGETAS